jgi:hypothetical protein
MRVADCAGNSAQVGRRACWMLRALSEEDTSMRPISLVMIVAALVTGALPAGVDAGDFATEISLERNEVRTEYRRVTRELEKVEGQIAHHEDSPTTVSGGSTAIWAVRESVRDTMRKLSNRRDELRGRKGELEREFQKLTGKVDAHYGEVPIWWGDID